MLNKKPPRKRKCRRPRNSSRDRTQRRRIPIFKHQKTTAIRITRRSSYSIRASSRARAQRALEPQAEPVREKVKRQVETWGLNITPREQEWLVKNMETN